MTLSRIQFGVQSNPAGGSFGAARFINCFAEDLGQEGKERVIIRAHDGLSGFATWPDAVGVRGIKVLDESTLILVAAQTVFEVASGGAATAVGSFGATGPVIMARNQKLTTPQIAIVEPGSGTRRIYEGGAVTDLSDGDLPTPNCVEFMDGFGVFGIEDGRVFVSAINDFSSIAASDFLYAQASSDPLVRVFRFGSDLIIFKTSHLEVWSNTGAADFPFARQGSLDVGLKAVHSVAANERRLLWVANDDTVRMNEGATVVSNYAVEKAIEAIDDASSLIGFMYAKGGEEFYTLSGDSWTWQFNTRTGAWNERESFIDGEATRWDAEGYAEFGSKHIVGSKTSRQLYVIDETANGEDGRDMVMTVQSPPQHSFPGGIEFNALFVDVEGGVGLNTTEEQAADPFLAMQWSDDGGRTWSNELQRPLGQIGDYATTVAFRRLGTTGEKGRTWRLRSAAQVTRKIASVYADIERVSP